MTEQVVVLSNFSVTRLELPFLARGIRGGRELESWTGLGTGFLLRFGDRGCVNEICKM